MPTVYVDQDLTLVNTRILPWVGSSVRPGEVKFLHAFKMVGTMARPSAEPFLRELGKHYDVHILTHGHSVFQRAVLKRLGLCDFVSSIYGVDNWQTLSKPEQFVLIDDMPKHSMLITYKMDWLGKNKFVMPENEYKDVLDRHHIQCAAFDGVGDAYPLTSLIPIIHRYLR